MGSNPFQIVQPPRPPQPAAAEIDPVCHMTVDPRHAAGTSVYNGRTYYFCSKGCLEKFEADPKHYVEPNRLKPVLPAGVVYTCPMHPEVRQIAPGSCPKCGMTLEPAEFSFDAAEEQPNAEYADMKRRFVIACFLTAPILVLAMLPMAGGRRTWVELALATPVVLWGGWPFFERAGASGLHRSPNMF